MTVIKQSNDISKSGFVDAQAASDHLRDDQVCTVRHEDSRIKPMRNRVRPRTTPFLERVGRSSRGLPGVLKKEGERLCD